jgi:class 3 adenylate cyclase
VPPPTTRYARSGDHNIAYQVYGDGPIDMLNNFGVLSHLEVLWEEPGFARLQDRMAAFGRVITMDARGVGMSDPLEGDESFEEEADDMQAVLDAAESEAAAVFGYASGGPYAIQFAARHPERVRALVLYATFATSVQTEEVHWADPPEGREARIAHMIEHWGEGLNIARLAPSADPALGSWFARLERLSASPGRMRALTTRMGEVDVSPLLPTLRVPTLVMHRTGDQVIDPRHSHFLAEKIPGAKLVELPGEDNIPFLGDVDSYVGEIEEFLTGGRSRSEPDRRLLTVLFTDICDGTKRAAELGDRRWRDLLATHDAEVRRQLERFGGKEVKTIGDGFLAVWEGPPTPAVRCARAIVDADLGVAVRAGLHTGECEVIGADIGGMAVHIAARVGALAEPREVLASGTTFGTVVGSGLRWESRGMHALRGVPGEWPLFVLRD